MENFIPQKKTIFFNEMIQILIFFLKTLKLGSAVLLLYNILHCLMKSTLNISEIQDDDDALLSSDIVQLPNIVRILSK